MTANNNPLKYKFEATEADAVVAVLLIPLTKVCVEQWGMFSLVISPELSYWSVRSFADYAAIPHNLD